MLRRGNVRNKPSSPRLMRGAPEPATGSWAAGARKLPRAVSVMRTSHAEATVGAMKPSARTLLRAIAGMMLLAACQQPATSSTELPSVAASMAPESMAESMTESMAESMSVAPTESPVGALDSHPLHGIPLLDVRSQAEVTLGRLAASKPVIVETMAIWCTSCRAQMHQVVAAHELADFHSLSIDVEAYEAPVDLAAYAEREGFDWPFVKADAELATLLRAEFGTAVLNPPSMPKILLRPDGSVELVGLGEELSAAEIAVLING